MPFRDVLVEHRSLTTHVMKAKQAVNRVYRAVGARQWTLTQAQILIAMAELHHAYAYIEEEIAAL
jgi:hypothetical protein